MDSPSDKQPTPDKTTETASSPTATKPPEIKSEPAPEPWQFKENEHINLLSDDEDDPLDIFNEKRPISTKRSKTTHSNPAFGAGNPKSDPKKVQEVRALMLAKQKQMADKFRASNPIPPKPTLESTIVREDGALPTATLNTRAVEEKIDQDPAAVSFAKVKQAYMKQKKAGLNSMKDDVVFIQAESAEAARLRKRKADEEYDNRSSEEQEYDEDSLFVQESSPGRDDCLETNGHAKSTAKRGRKRKQVPGVDCDNDEDRPPKRSKSKARGTKGSIATETDCADSESTPAPNGAKSKTGRSKSRKAKPVKKKKNEKSITNIPSLWGSNIFEDTAKVAHLPTQPKTNQEGGRRPDALNQLMASVATGSGEAAKADKKLLNEAIIAFTGQGSVSPAGDDSWKLRGMRSTLKHFQVIGAGCMRRMEKQTEDILEKAANGDHSDLGPRGGILADQMGLGKTIMMLANIVNGKVKKSARPKATLVVASPALVLQWFDEIRRHCESDKENKHGLGRIWVYKSSERHDDDDIKEIVQGADIVLTTYNEVCGSYPKAQVPPDLVTSAQKDAWWREYYADNRGLLHDCKWLRVVLDEAQAIKNHKSHTSMACRALEAQHYWAITGTPVQNTVNEFYPYFKFIRDGTTGSFRQFRENFSGSEGFERLCARLSPIMIRRAHNDVLFEARLVALPTPAQSTLYLEFNDIERQIYEIIKKRFILRINKICKTDGLQAQYSNVWTMILRLRQLCSNVLLVLRSCLDLLEREDFEKLNALTQTEHDGSDEGEAILIYLRHLLETKDNPQQTMPAQLGGNITKVEAFHTGVTDIGATEGQTGGKHGIYFRFRKYFSAMLDREGWKAVQERTLCCGCRQVPDDPQITSCYHIYCYSCLIDLQHCAARRGQDQSRCSECGEAYLSSQPCEDLEAFLKRDHSTQRGGEDSAKRNEKEKTTDFLSLPGEVLPSAKTRAIKAQLLNWWNEDPSVKVIIYTQFLDMIKILSSICKTESWDHQCYTGNMSHGSRAKSLEEFQTNDDKKLLLASLKCGGLGLNLTAASKVILIDAWWNNSVEEQAFCRVFRIGQQRETKMLRIVIRNSIDEALMAVKDRKQKEIDQVMKKAKLSFDDVLGLFGEVGKDGEGRPFIIPDWDYIGPENSRLANVDKDDEDQHMGNEA